MASASLVARFAATDPGVLYPQDLRNVGLERTSSVWIIVGGRRRVQVRVRVCVLELCSGLAWLHGRRGRRSDDWLLASWIRRGCPL